MIKTRNSRKLYEDEEDLDKIYNVVDKIINSPKKFRDNFDKLEEFVNAVGFIYIDFDELKRILGEQEGYDYVLDVLLDSLKEYPNDNKPLAKGDTDCYCFFYQDTIMSYYTEKDAIESMRVIIANNNLLDTFVDSKTNNVVIGILEDLL
jgi:hypothetical protein